MADTMPTTAQEVYDSFESSFADKCVIPDELELVWLLRAIGRYTAELDPLTFDEYSLLFDKKLDRYTIDTLAAYMKQSYQERETSKVNKRASVIGKDLSINGGGHLQVAAREELAYDVEKAHEMTDNQKPTAYV